MCVQNFDGSRGFAIRITYRISLRSSSLWEPRHPLLKVVRGTYFHTLVPETPIDSYEDGIPFTFQVLWSSPMIVLKDCLN
jgi:hypothetical protein